jgi:hypothetical protein
VTSDLAFDGLHELLAGRVRRQVLQPFVQIEGLGDDPLDRLAEPFLMRLACFRRL